MTLMQAHALMQGIREKTSRFREHTETASNKVQKASDPLKRACEEYFNDADKEEEEAAALPSEQAQELSAAQRELLKEYLETKEVNKLENMDELPYSFNGTDGQLLAQVLITLAVECCRQGDLESAAESYERAFHNDHNNQRLIDTLEKSLGLTLSEELSYKHIFEALSNSSSNRRRVGQNLTNKSMTNTASRGSRKRKSMGAKPKMEASRKSMCVSSSEDGLQNVTVPKGPRRVPRRQK